MLLGQFRDEDLNESIYVSERKAVSRFEKVL